MLKCHYEAKNFDRLYGTPGFSEELLKNHFALYQGYVKNVNQLLDHFDRMLSENKMQTPEFGEMKRRFGWEWNGVRLHEYYFGNMTQERNPFDSGSKLAGKIKEDFGSFDDWGAEFRSTGAMRGIGWAVLYYDTVQDHLWNVWINEHDTGHLAGAEPVLIMDVFEHAFMLDYGVKKAGYIEAFYNAICWRTLEERFETAWQKMKREENLRRATAA